jgi:hypothetical protein
VRKTRLRIPLPAPLGDLYNNIKSEKSKDSLRNTGLSEKQEYDLLIRKIDSITKSCTKAYFNKILKNLTIENFENASIICDLYTV